MLWMGAIVYRNGKGLEIATTMLQVLICMGGTSCKNAEWQDLLLCFFPGPCFDGNTIG